MVADANIQWWAEHIFRADGVTQVAIGSTTSYKASDMCGIPANDTGFLDPGDALHPLLKRHA